MQSKSPSSLVLVVRSTAAAETVAVTLSEAGVEQTYLEAVAGRVAVAPAAAPYDAVGIGGGGSSSKRLGRDCGGGPLIGCAGAGTNGGRGGCLRIKIFNPKITVNRENSVPVAKKINRTHFHIVELDSHDELRLKERVHRRAADCA